MPPAAFPDLWLADFFAVFLLDFEARAFFFEAFLAGRASSLSPSPSSRVTVGATGAREETIGATAGAAAGSGAGTGASAAFVSLFTGSTAAAGSAFASFASGFAAGCAAGSWLTSGAGVAWAAGFA